MAVEFGRRMPGPDDDPWQEVMSSEDAMISRLLSFLDASPSPYHAVGNLAARLKDFGYASLDEGQSWARSLEPGGRYYFTRNGSAMVAFAIGKKYVNHKLLSCIYFL